MQSTTDGVLYNSTPVCKEHLADRLDKLIEIARNIDARAVTPEERVQIVSQTKRGKTYDPVVMYYPNKTRQGGRSLGKVNGPGHREFLLGQKKTAFLRRIDKLHFEMLALQGLADQLESEIQEWTGYAE